MAVHPSSWGLFTTPFRCCNPRWCKDYTCTGDIPKLRLVAESACGRGGDVLLNEYSFNVPKCAKLLIIIAIDE